MSASSCDWIACWLVAALVSWGAPASPVCSLAPLSSADSSVP